MTSPRTLIMTSPLTLPLEGREIGYTVFFRFFGGGMLNPLLLHTLFCFPVTMIETSQMV